MSEWKDLSKNALDNMADLGDFGPTVNAQLKKIKGYMWDSEDSQGYSVYYTAEDLRNLSAACIEVADWLDERASQNSQI